MPTASSRAAATRNVVIERVIDAPRSDVFRAWSDASQLKQWWAPKGWTASHVDVDFRPGGVFHFCMRSPEGQEVWGRGVFEEIVAPRRIVYIDSFSDPEGRIVERPGYDREAKVTVTFDDDAGRTVVTIRYTTRQDFGEIDGWKEMLDRLGEHLAAAGKRRTKTKSEAKP